MSRITNRVLNSTLLPNTRNQNADNDNDGNNDDEGLEFTNFSNGSLLDLLNFDSKTCNLSGGFNSERVLPSNVCFLSIGGKSSKCNGPITNLLCRNCNLAIRKIDIKHTGRPSACGTNAIQQTIIPYSTQTLENPLPIYPLLSLLGKANESDLQFINSCDNSDIINTYKTILKILSNVEPNNSSALTNPYLLQANNSNNFVNDNLIISTYASKAAFPFIEPLQKPLSTIRIQVFFSNNYQPRNRLSTDLFNRAIPIGNNIKGLQIPLLDLKNVFDIASLALYLPSQILTNNTSLSVIPNVQILNGWVTYGSGFGHDKIPDTIELKYPNRTIVKTNDTADFDLIVSQAHLQYHIVPMNTTPLYLDAISTDGYNGNVIVVQDRSGGHLTDTKLALDTCLLP